MSDRLSRREFIQDSMLTATTLTAGASLPARAAAQKTPPEQARSAAADVSSLPPRTIQPWPSEVVWGRERLKIQHQAALHLSPGVDAPAIAIMKDLWRQFTLGAVELSVSTDLALAGAGFVLSSSAQAPEQLPDLKQDAAYALRASPAGIAARGADLAGVRYAWFTLLQLLQPEHATDGTLSFTLPHVTIQDGPALKFRGVHLCVFPETTPLMLEKAIRLAGFLKFTHVVIEFWGMLRLEAQKELSWPEAWSKTEARGLLEIARGMGLEVVPMFNCWGHAPASRLKCGRHVVLDQNPALAPLFEPDGWTWCLSSSRTQGLLRQVCRELIEFAGPGEFFHIGCDEAYSHATCDRCRQHDPVRLFADHINDLAVHLERLGRRPIMWGDTLLESGKWPAGFVANGSAALPTHQALDRLSRRIVIADWHYDVNSGNVATLAHFRERGFATLACPWDSAANIVTLAKGAAAHGALGMLATTWHHLSDYIPQLAFTANAAWSRDAAALRLRQCSGTHLSLASASLLRKLVPAQGHFDRAGWYPFEMAVRPV